MPRELPTINWHSQLLEEGLRQTKEKEMKPKKEGQVLTVAKRRDYLEGSTVTVTRPGQHAKCTVTYSSTWLPGRQTGVKGQHRPESSRGLSFHTCSCIHKKQSHGKSLSNKVSLDFLKYHNPPYLEHASEHVTKSSAKVSVNLRVAWKLNRRGNSEST